MSVPTPRTGLPRALRVGTALAFSGLVALTLSACSPSGSAASPSQGTSDTTPATSAPQPDGQDRPATPSATPTPTPDPPTPVSIDCAALVTPQQMYDFNPNFSNNPNHTPAKDSVAATAVAQKGTACTWVNETSGLTITVAIAKPAPSTLQKLEDRATQHSHWVPTYGSAGDVEGYFSPGDTGVAQVFTKGYWVVADSTIFSEPGVAQPIVAAALANLPK